jgi:predicted mannosyl-3-phosphoglycerate phosphatase (HAD superfamily)
LAVVPQPHLGELAGFDKAWHLRVRKRSNNKSKRIVVFTDPDGTLLEHRRQPCLPTYDIRSSARTVAPCIFRAVLSRRHSDAAEQSAYDVLAFGAPHQHVIEALRRTAQTLRTEVRSFNDMPVQEVADECGLSLAEARLAQLREYDEPFRILEADPAISPCANNRAAP